MANVHQTTSPRMFAVVEVTGYLRMAVAALFAVAAVFVVWRRLAGALETPLAPIQLLAAGLLLAALARLARAPLPAGRPHAASVLILLALLAVAASLSLRGSHGLALFGFWAMIVGEELWTWRGLLPARRWIFPRLGHHLPMVAGEGWGVRDAAPHAPPNPPSAANGGSIEEPELIEPAADVLQQLTLRSTAAGGQELSGWLRMPLAAGQRSGSLHVVFCPSFREAPQVQAEPVSGPDCRVKAAQVLSYGARLDIKLEEPANKDQSLLLWFFASCRA